MSYWYRKNGEKEILRIRKTEKWKLNNFESLLFRCANIVGRIKGFFDDLCFWIALHSVSYVVEIKSINFCRLHQSFFLWNLRSLERFFWEENYWKSFSKRKQGEILIQFGVVWSKQKKRRNFSLRWETFNNPLPKEEWKRQEKSIT